MASVEKIIEGFPHTTIPPHIVGQPVFETLKALKLFLNKNAASLVIHLGTITLGLLWLNVSDAAYKTLSLAAFVPPINPGLILIIPDGSTQFLISAVTKGHISESKLFHDFNNTDKTLKQ